AGGYSGATQAPGKGVGWLPGHHTLLLEQQGDDPALWSQDTWFWTPDTHRTSGAIAGKPRKTNCLFKSK
ncbi:MAG: hypothetical protein V2I51_03770, partial [Anderseniella sp.]|nr:hypothetical protein [Anderseniella sp.]